ncbi:retinol dehydrogenase 13-like [Arctopsyche grandis]|uniref:retinol dehydrogenase 13-like n=1 Tax=Arctopsyche grandis TaxID=121162 RepID=UPI00406D821C
MFRRKTFIFFSIAGATAGGICLIKDLISGKFFDTNVRADNKVFIVTGANTGIGKETAKHLAAKGGKVYMACRDMEKCEKVRTDIVINSKNKYVYCRPLDLSSFESIRTFVSMFKMEQDRLDVLINNAGVMRCPKDVTAEGIEMQLGVNHMGHFLLTNLLLDTLKKSSPSRIVVVASTAHSKGTINKEDLNLDKEYDPAVAYNQSKLANVLFMNHLSTLLLGTNVTVNAVHPGLVDTDITRHMAIARGFTGFLFRPLFWPFVKNAKAGAQQSLYAALDPDMANVTGQYICDYKVTETSESAKDIELARWLWAVSEKWTRLNT